jgi:hypothetical protein
VAWSLERQGANHELWRCGAVEGDGTEAPPDQRNDAVGILRSLEEELGEGWWR